VLVDLASTNGTMVNGQPVDHQRLVDGDVITIGAHHLRFEAS
jgi:pSer/pThr/pTyr-binding forkhead associated (FHA) protein